jgi:S-adenosylmethionine:tRNA ribosyltransferase-isomerase
MEKKSPKILAIEDFDYELPDEKVAKHPLSKRDESKLLIWQNETLSSDRYFNLDKYLPEDSMLVLNNTRVVEARLLFKKTSGTTIEIFCLEPGDVYADITSAMLQTKKVIWKCLVGNAKKWKDELLEKTFQYNNRDIVLIAKKISRQQENFIIEFSWNDDVLSFAEVLHIAGIVPLPPYLHRHADIEDTIRYQTVYAKNDGSVAAPTAGLHFTDELFKKLSVKNITRSFVTLHVGAGTFKPVKSKTIEEHEMHAEFFEVSIELIEQLLNRSSKKIIAVGTTSLRTLESLYWMGIKLVEVSKRKNLDNISVEEIRVKQWDPYEFTHTQLNAEDALQKLIEWMHVHDQTKLMDKTQIIIAPPYRLKIADALITNFHQPRSTLLLLVAAVIGPEWKKIYEYALQNNFRFLSYGDGCLLFAS